MASDDPRSIRLVVVTADDVVAALEANERREVGALLRVTPPFSGRMRARIHLDGTESEYGDPEPIHIPPERFVRPVPPFPGPDETEDELRSDPNAAYTPERHRKRHESAVDAWRKQVRSALVEELSFETGDDRHRARLATLG